MKPIPEWYFDYVKDNTKCKILDTEYENSASKIKFLCECGEIFERNFSKFKFSEHKCCNKCIKEQSNKKLYTSYNYIKDFIESNSESKLLYEFFKDDKRILKIKCSCGETLNINARWFKKHSKKCKKCSKKDVKSNLVKGNIDVINDELKKYGLYTIENEYYGVDYDMKFICRECNEIFISTVYKIRISKYKCCNRCALNLTSKTNKNHEYFIKKLGNKAEDYIFHEKYIDIETPILITHKYCENSYKIKPRNLYKSDNCPVCNKNSKGEYKIYKYLSNNKFNFKKQYRIKECKNIRSLPFDFAIFDIKDNLKLLIEYDGISHYTPTNFGNFNNEELIKSYMYTKKNDLIKNKFCRDNNIRLVRIPYWDYDKINNILRYNLIL